jgi:hypothetical protein
MLAVYVFTLLAKREKKRQRQMAVARERTLTAKAMQVPITPAHRQPFSLRLNTIHAKRLTQTACFRVPFERKAGKD